MYKLAAVAVALALFAVPAAIADHQEDESIAQVPVLEIYISSSGLFSETNDFAGLQTEDFESDHDADGEELEEAITVEADESLLP